MHWFWRLRSARPRIAAAACASLCLFATFVDAANRLTPEQVNLTAFAAIDPDAVTLLVRVPLAAVKDIEIPTTDAAGALDTAALQSMLPGAARYWIAPSFSLFENGAPMGAATVDATRLSIAADRSFDAFETARAHLDAPALTADERVFLETTWFDLQLRYPRQTPDSHISLAPVVAPLGVKVSSTLTALTPDGPLTFSFEGDPGRLHLPPRPTDAGSQFLARGARLIVTGAEALLLIVCLVLPFRRVADLMPVLATFGAAFGVAAAAVVGGVIGPAIWLSPLVETLLSMVLLLTALANVIARVTPRRRALLALPAGAILGAFAALQFLATRQFAGTHPWMAAVAFAGGALATVAVAVALLVPLLRTLFSWTRAERLERIVVSALAADTAWMWLGDRWALLAKIPWNWPALDAAALLKLAALLVLAGGAVWLTNEWLKARPSADRELMVEPS